MIALGDLDPITNVEAGQPTGFESVGRIDDPSVVRQNVAGGLGLGELVDLVGRGATQPRLFFQVGDHPAGRSYETSFNSLRIINSMMASLSGASNTARKSIVFLPRLRG